MNIYEIIIFIIIFLSFINLTLCLVFPLSTCYSFSKEPHKYLDNVHFNREHPENRNIKMTNLLGPYMDYIKEGKWNKIEKNILIPKIIDKSIDVVDEIAYKDLDADTDEEDNKLNSWEKYSDIKYGDNKKLKDKITKKATRQIYNETNKNPEEIKI